MRYKNENGIASDLWVFFAFIFDFLIFDSHIWLSHLCGYQVGILVAKRGRATIDWLPQIQIYFLYNWRFLFAVFIYLFLFRWFGKSLPFLGTVMFCRTHNKYDGYRSTKQRLKGQREEEGAKKLISPNCNYLRQNSVLMLRKLSVKWVLE